MRIIIASITHAQEGFVKRGHRREDNYK